MYYKKTPRLLAFATKDLWRSAKRFKNQAEGSNYFSEVKILSNNDLDNFCKEKINFIINNSGKRGSKRDKKYSIIRRFLNRQTKNLKRVLEYINI